MNCIFFHDTVSLWYDLFLRQMTSSQWRKQFLGTSAERVFWWYCHWHWRLLLPPKPIIEWQIVRNWERQKKSDNVGMFICRMNKHSDITSLFTNRRWPMHGRTEHRRQNSCAIKWMVPTTYEHCKNFVSKECLETKNEERRYHVVRAIQWTVRYEPKQREPKTHVNCLDNFWVIILLIARPMNIIEQCSLSRTNLR